MKWNYKYIKKNNVTLFIKQNISIYSYLIDFFYGHINSYSTHIYIYLHMYTEER